MSASTVSASRHCALRCTAESNVVKQILKSVEVRTCILNCTLSSEALHHELVGGCRLVVFGALAV